VPRRLTSPEAICVLAAGAGAVTETVGIVRGSSTLQRLGLATMLFGLIPVISRHTARDANSRHFNRLRAEFDAYRKAETEAMHREVEAREAEIEGAAFAKALALWRTGELNPEREPGIATVTALHPHHSSQGNQAKKIRA